MEELVLVPRRHRVQLTSCTDARRSGRPGSSPAASAPPDALAAVRRDVAAFAGVAPRGPARLPAGRRRRRGRRDLARRPPRRRSSVAVPVDELGRVPAPVRRVRGARPAALRGRRVLRPGRRAAPTWCGSCTTADRPRRRGWQGLRGSARSASRAADGAPVALSPARRAAGATACGSRCAAAARPLSGRSRDRREAARRRPAGGVRRRSAAAADPRRRRPGAALRRGGRAAEPDPRRPRASAAPALDAPLPRSPGARRDRRGEPARSSTPTRSLRRTETPAGARAAAGPPALAGPGADHRVGPALARRRRGSAGPSPADPTAALVTLGPATRVHRRARPLAATIVPGGLLGPALGAGRRACPAPASTCLADVDDVGLLVAPDLYDPAPLAPPQDVLDPVSLAGPDSRSAWPPNRRRPRTPAPPGLDGSAARPAVRSTWTASSPRRQALVAFAEHRREFSRAARRAARACRRPDPAVAHGVRLAVRRRLPPVARRRARRTTTARRWSGSTRRRSPRASSPTGSSGWASARPGQPDRRRRGAGRDRGAAGRPRPAAPRRGQRVPRRARRHPAHGGPHPQPRPAGAAALRGAADDGAPAHPGTGAGLGGVRAERAGAVGADPARRAGLLTRFFEGGAFAERPPGRRSSSAATRPR